MSNTRENLIAKYCKEKRDVEKHEAKIKESTRE